MGIEYRKADNYIDNCNSINNTLNKAMQLLTNEEDKENIIQAKRIIWSLQVYYNDLDSLCKRLQDNLYAEFEDYNFEIDEQDTNSLAYVLDLVCGFTNGLAEEDIE